MNEKKTLQVCLILPDVFPVPATGGGAVETLISNLIEMNKKDRNIQITVCSIYDDKAACIVRENNNYENVKFYWTHPQKAFYKVRHFFFRVIRKLFKFRIVPWQAHYSEIASLIKQENFDLLIAEAGDYKAVLDISRKYYKSSQLALHLHGHDLPDRVIASGYGVLLGVSNYVIDEYVKWCKEQPKTYLLRNCIEISKFDKPIKKGEREVFRKKIGLEQEDFVVLYVGRIHEEKGVLELMEAVTGIIDKTVKLLIVGSPYFTLAVKSPYLKKVIDFASTYKDRIKITGYIPNDELYRYYQIADIQCVPSIVEEAAGLVAIEGMAAGLPLIVTNSGGLVEYVTDKTAVVVRRENLIENLREAINELRSDERIRTEMSIEAKEHVKEYNMEKYYDNFVEIVRDVLKERT